MIFVKKLTPKEWSEFSEMAHLIVFNEKRSKSMDRVDFALIVENEKGVPLTYATCKELDSETVYMQYGGAFPSSEKTTLVFKCYDLMINFLMLSYKRIGTMIENKNKPMLKLAMKKNFIIVGMRNFHNSVLLEHMLEE